MKKNNVSTYSISDLLLGLASIKPNISAAELDDMILLVRFIRKNHVALDVKDKPFEEIENTLENNLKVSLGDSYSKFRETTDTMASLERIRDKHSLLLEIKKSLLAQTQVISFFLDNSKSHTQQLQSLEDKIMDKRTDPQTRIAVATEILEITKGFETAVFASNFRLLGLVLALNALTEIITNRGDSSINNLYDETIKKLAILLLSRQIILLSITVLIEFDRKIPTLVLKHKGSLDFETTREEVEVLAKAGAMLKELVPEDIKRYEDCILSLVKVVEHTKDLPDAYTRLEKFMASFAIEYENLPPTQLEVYASNLRYLHSLPDSIKGLLVEMCLDYLEIPYQEYYTYITEENSFDTEGHLLLLMLELIESFIPNVKLDTNGLSVNTGLLGLTKSQISRAQIIEIFERFEKNPKRFLLSKVKQQIETLLDEEVTLYIMRKNNNDKG